MIMFAKIIYMHKDQQIAYVSLYTYLNRTACLFTELQNGQ